MDEKGSDVNTNSEEVEVKGPGGISVRARGYDILTLLGVAGLSLLAYIMYQHSQDERSSKVEIIQTMQKIAESQEEMSYLISLSSEDRAKLRLDMPDSLRKRLRDSR